MEAFGPSTAFSAVNPWATLLSYSEIYSKLKLDLNKTIHLVFLLDPGPSIVWPLSLSLKEVWYQIYNAGILDAGCYKPTAQSRAQRDAQFSFTAQHSFRMIESTDWRDAQSRLKHAAHQTNSTPAHVHIGWGKNWALAKLGRWEMTETGQPSIWHPNIMPAPPLLSLDKLFAWMT